MAEAKKGAKVRFAVHVKPHANKIAVEKDNDNIRISLTASPRKGLANRQLIEILSKELRIAKCCISIVRGLKSHDKLIEINDITEKILNNWMEGI
ncbi:MAG: DUF167 domain-containing protein [Epsilonproteobacteria bacterium]|nr:DUF167 domain-containing protein [Campylobacterota bacterium]